MTALLYRGHTYAAAPATPKACVELTYRREHYNTCRRELMAKAAAPSPTGASPTPSSPKPLLAPAPALPRAGFFVGQPDGGKPRSKGDPGILWASQSAFADGIGPNRHRDLLGVPWGGFCDCQVLSRGGVVGSSVLGWAGDSQHRPGLGGLISKKMGVFPKHPAFDALPPSPKEAFEE